MSENHRRTVRPLCSEPGRPTFAVLMGTADRSILNMALEHAFLNYFEEGVSWKNEPRNQHRLLQEGSPAKRLPRSELRTGVA